MMKTMLVVILLVGICQVMTAPNPAKLEDYLYQYGYMPATDRENGVKRSERDLEQGTMRLQKFMGLEMTGKLDEPTLELIGKPRCGMPDMVVKDAGLQGIVEINDGPANYSTQGRPWTSFPVTYGFINRTPDLPAWAVDADIDAAFKRWSDVSSQLTLEKVSDYNADSSDIPISFGAGKHGACPYPFDGASGTLAHAYFPQNGDMHFDEDETWTHGTSYGINLLYVAIHELGHSLGIAHSSIYDAIMFPNYKYLADPQLHADDIAAIRSLYGAGC